MLWACVGVCDMCVNLVDFVGSSNFFYYLCSLVVLFIELCVIFE